MLVYFYAVSVSDKGLAMDKTISNRIFIALLAIYALMAALAFAIAHLPALMFNQGWTDVNQIPSMLLVEIVLLNGLLGMCAAWAFKKYGFLAPVGMHFWADIVWHVLWGLF